MKQMLLLRNICSRIASYCIYLAIYAPCRKQAYKALKTSLDNSGRVLTPSSIVSACRRTNHCVTTMPYSDNAPESG
jgi:hypothetical protein